MSERRKEISPELAKENKTLKSIFDLRKKELGLTQEKLAQILGMTQPGVGHYLNGRNALTLKIATQFAKVLEVQIADFSERLDKELRDLNGVLAPKENEITAVHAPQMWSRNTPLPEDDYVFTPFLKETVFLGGNGSVPEEDYNGFKLPFSKATLYKKGIQAENVFCCTLMGDSMETKIPEDATIAVDKGDKTIKDGKIYAFVHDDLYRVKYLTRKPGGLVQIQSENRFYKDEIVPLSDINVIGRVFWWAVLD